MTRIKDLLAALAARGVTVTREGDGLKVRGPAGAVPPEMRAEMAARKAEILAFLGGGQPAPLAPRPDPSAPAPLAFNQRRLWFLDTLDGGTAFVMAAGWEIDGPFDAAALARALTALTARHTVLNTVIREEDGGPCMVPLSPAPFALAEEDAPGADPAAIVGEAARRPFRLADEPPFRARLVRVGPDRRVLVLSLHHIVSDRWSMGVLMRDLSALYGEAVTGVPAALPPLPVQYADVAAWQHATADEGRMAEQVEAWCRQLDGAPTDLALPLDRPRPPVRGDQGGMVRFTLPPAVAEALTRLARAEQATPFMALLAVYAAVLARWSGQDEVTIGCPAGGRDRVETQNLVGFFVNNLVLRADLTDDPGFAALLRRLRAVCLDAFSRQDVPFDRVVEALNPERALNRGPLFQAMFVLQTATVEPLAFAGVRVRPVESGGGASELDLNLSLEAAADGGLLGHLEYDAGLFDAATMERLAGDVVRLAAAAVERPGTPISALPLFTTDERDALIAAGGPLSGPLSDETVPALIAGQAARNPDAPALIHGDTTVTYGALDAAASALARRLTALGVGPGTPVGVATGRGPHLVTALLAVYKAGGAHVVFDPAQPAARTHAIIADTAMTVVIGPDTLAERLPAGLTLVTPDNPPLSPAGRGPVLPLPGPGDLAYICFTSGSTGAPKGVMVEHGGLANHARAVIADYRLEPGDRVLQFAAPEFDVALEEILPTLVAGATLVLPADGMAADLGAFTEALGALGITIANLPAAFWHAWVRHLAETATPLPPTLRLVVTGSDRVSTERLAEWRALAGPRTAWRNAYGPTEATITATLFDPAVDQAPETGTVPIGRPIAGTRVHVLDSAGQPVPPGVVGEIVIAGPGVARGYLNRDGETAARFRPDPFVPGASTFWTGDRARRRADGTLEFLGRRDDQVKIRGFRIEPGEVAAALARHPRVTEAAVLPLPGPGGEPRLVAFAETAADAAELLEWLRGALPAYMVPAAAAPLPSLPKTAGGKVDRRALAALAPADAPAPTPAAPRTEAERTLAGIFAAVLGLPAVGVFDNFFDLGGDSIRSLQIVSRARHAGFDLTVRHLFQHQTVAALAAATAGAAPAAAVTGPDHGPVPPLPVQAWFHAAITDDPHHYNQGLVLAVPAAIDADALERALDALIDRHGALRLRIIDGVQTVPRAGAGPYGVLRRLGPGAVTAEERAAAFAAAQTGFDLSRGPLLRAVLDPAAGRLLMTAHHLAVDAASWPVLLDGLAVAYEQAVRGEEPALPAPTTPYRLWAEKLADLAASTALTAEAAWWRDTLGGPAVPLLPAGTDPGTVGGAARLVLDLDADQTGALLRGVPAAFGVRPDAALLAALQRAVWRLTGGTRLRVDVERHGRADLFEGIDLSRTVGWFTTVQPLRLDHPGAPDPRAEVAASAAALRAAPREGMGYGLLRHLSPDAGIRAAMAALPDAELLVNYLGVMDGPADGGTFVPVDEPPGPLLSPRARRSHAVELNAGVWRGCLRLDITFPPCAEATVTALAEATRTALVELAEAAGRMGPEPLPLTPLQQGVLAHSLRDPDTYFDQLRLRLDGPLDAGRLRAAWDALVERHESLRAAFRWQDGGQPVQVFAPRTALPWREEDWRSLSPAAQDARMERLLAEDRAAGFTLDRPPLMRMHLVRTSDTTHDLLWSSHHLLMDGWSVSVLAGELFALYRGTPLPPAPRFGDYVRHQASLDRAASDAFWREELAGIEAATPIMLPGLAPDPADDPDGGGAEIHAPLSTDETAALTALAQRGRVTLGAIVQGAWALLLHHYTGQRDVVFGVTVSGRPPDLAGAETMVGMLINTVPARVTVDGDEPGLPWLQRLFARHLERDRFGATPLGDIVRASALPAGTDLFHSLVLFQNYPAAGELEADGLRLTGVRAYERTNFPLTLVCQPGPVLHLGLHYDPRRFAGSAVRRMLGHLRTLLAGLAAAPEAPLSAHTLLGRDERAVLVAAGRGPVLPVTAPFAHALPAAWAATQPDAPALEGHDGTLTYAQLDAATAALAARLAAAGVGVGTPVAVCLRRSAGLAVAFLAVLRAGGIAVPLDPDYPAERLRFMLDDSGTRLVLAGAGTAGAVADIGVSVMDIDVTTVMDAPAWTPPVPGPADVAYLIYTSGSTGRPKGVESTHGGLRNLIQAQRHLFALKPGDRVLQFASPSFDASVWEIAMALGAGGTLLLPGSEATRPGPDLARTLEEARVTAATLPPTALAVMPDAPLPALRLLVVAGEACAPDLARRWAAGRRFVNAYGPTESSVCATLDEGGGDGRLLPIGRPLPNIDVHLLDERGVPVPVGVPGELHIGGAGLARGYRHRPDLTDERFITHPAWGRLYRTGDIGYRLEDGRIQFLGRRDHQVKLRGHRIELGEVEAVLAAHPAVTNAAAVVRDGRLLAYAAAAEGTVDEAALRDHLRARLPAHMIPARIAVLPALPLTPNGKTDRAALPDPDAPPAERAARALRGDAERTLAAIWAQVLGVPSVGPDDAFFDLGGDSILAIQVVARANQAGLPITLNQLLTAGQQTVAALVALIGEAGGIAAIADDPDTDAPQPVPPTPIQRWFFGLGAPDPHHYNQGFLLDVPGDLDPARLERAARAVLAHHDALRLRACHTADGWVLERVPADHLTAPVLEVRDLGQATPHAIETAAAEAQTGFDLSAGPLLRLVLLRLGAGDRARLLVAAHHLGIDAVSWRFLLDDLFDGYVQAASGPIHLPARTSTFRQWAERVAETAATPALERDAAHWLAPRPPLARLPDTGHTRSTVGDAVRLERSFPAPVTEALLRTLPKRSGAAAQDALLAALATAATTVLGGDALLVDVEGHGRDAPVPGVDLTRTVGWFTTIAPVVLPAPASAPPARTLAAARAAVAGLPGRGFSYGALRALNPRVGAALAALEPAEVLFNYLGQWDQSWPTAVPVRPAAESEGPGFAPTTPRPYRLEVAALVMDGHLRMDWTYDPRQTDAAVVERLADAFAAALNALLDDGTPAAEAEAEEETPRTLAPQQAAMLAHATAHPGSEAYVAQLAATLPDGLDVPAFQAAWDRALSRHAALRAAFITGADGAAEQRFPSRVQAPWRLEDWRDPDPAAEEARFATERARDRHAGFDPATAPLMRFTLAQGAAGYRFIWTHHHLLMDGWSMPLLLEEVRRAYDGAAPDQPAPDFRAFLTWLERQDAAAARAFWADALAGLPPAALAWPPVPPDAPAGHRFAEVVRTPPPAVGTALTAFARRHRLTVPAVVMGAWALVLGRYTGSDDVVFGVTSALRPPDLPGVEGMIGPLINTLPLRVLPPGAAPLPAWLAGVQRRRAAQTAHAHLSIAAVAGAAGLAPGQAPFTTTLRVQTYPAGKDGGGLRFADAVMTDHWHYPLNLEVVPGEAMVVAAGYDTALFTATAVEDILGAFLTTLTAVAEGRTP
ncbi:amino acid adenylation domain-containing protein/non-ribosomal peptide synthase protein (TIGR01720 family) [Azospirillum fermentarium]|uniref:non-ribosomal peptide synthetase n=1 Tax=Azospirillum fermentarium TaxID=1233114 RepID=UPI002225EC9B|nr:non-ribosomal peptide synthetase [Azospirillum fermentarium]MCW2246954.1 amino acid adenylation domain-containing protein/non-ribosomal peptide synthase protein (TIGR01720 family) [Azospirillum fermentarium]